MSNENPEKWTPPQLTASSARRPLFATDDQITDVTAMYVAEMRARGHDVPDNNIAHLERAARIQDVWRVAFDYVMNRSAPPVPLNPLASYEPKFSPEIVDMLTQIAAATAPKDIEMTRIPTAALTNLVEAARAVLKEYEAMLDSGDAGTSSDWRDHDKVCKRLRDILP